MSKTIDARVYLQDHFPEHLVTEVASAVQQRFGATVHLLARCSAMMVVWTGVATQKGRNPENLENTAKGTPIAVFIRGFLPQGKMPTEIYDNLPVYVPAHKYAIDLWLSPHETRGRFIQTGYTHFFRGEKAVEYALVYKTGWTKGLPQILIPLVERWHKDAIQEGFGGEKLRPSELIFSEEEKQFVFRLSNYEPVTIPWLELYLRLRAHLPRKQWPNGFMYRPVPE